MKLVSVTVTDLPCKIGPSGPIFLAILSSIVNTTMEPLVHLNYTVDKKQLLELAHNFKSQAVAYTDSRYPDLKLEDWLIGKCSSIYIESIMQDFGVNGKPRFYYLQPYAEIPEHVDNGTLCSLNFVLTENASPIMFGDREYHYDAVLLDTTVPHKVKNNQYERIMLKISIFNESYEQVLEKIKKWI